MSDKRGHYIRTETKGNYIRTEKHRQQIADRNRKWVRSQETRNKISIGHKGKHSPLKGRKMTEEQKTKLSLSKKGKPNLKIRGENSPHWKGGVTPRHERIRDSIEYGLWRNSVFARDNWTCQDCGIRGAYLEAHHIKSFSCFPELRFAIDNGLTLCKSCHNKTKEGRPCQI